MKLYAILSVTTLLLGSSSTVEASECKGPPCGRFENDTPWAAKWADLGMTPHLCQLTTVTKPVKCKQFDLAARSSRGGYFHSPRTDVDAFCYANRKYHVKFGPRGQQQSVGAGVWVKINSLQTAKCVAKNEEPYCTVL
ncbi:hypothetical protein FSARC_8891 [Fusarium sarcochroum]|uniref:Uncharacterized protein n=1 Tax=Fusarium sarcochroum TaxID=1208366 RepID=A0A8H4TS44_9HYPO|nr:hypothetical protein FSARC_8891 [Fusarium sarcochroum]